jgi:hypothetical protein
VSDIRVTPQRWLWQPRSKPIRMIEIHATRGNTPPAKQMQAALNWVQSPNNVGGRDASGNPAWGSSFSHVIGTDGSLGTVLDDNQMPTYSAGYGGAGSTYAIDEYAISYELAQSPAQEPFSDAIYDRLVQEIAVDCKRYGIPPVMISISRQTGAVPTGIVRHDRCENGIKLGKTDPGDQFDEARFIADVKVEMEDEMDEAEVRKIAKQEAEFAVKVNRENQDGFNQHQFNLIQQASDRAVTAHEATPHGGGSEYTDEQAVKAVKDKL